MKSIYSIKALQRILDHWGIGQIEDVTYFDSVGRNIWRHYIDTNQGEFELYSYPVGEKEYAEQKLAVFLQDHYGNHLQFLQKNIVHSFDRYHVLLQLTKKHRINIKQTIKDLDLLIDSTIEKAFRVYGTIFQMHLDEADVKKASVVVSYGNWSIQNYNEGRANIVADSKIHSYDQLDSAIEAIEKDKPLIKKYVVQSGWFELYLSNGTSLHFKRSSKFPAVEVHLNSRKNDLLIFEENEMYYTQDLERNKQSFFLTI